MSLTIIERIYEQRCLQYLKEEKAAGAILAENTILLNDGFYEPIQSIFCQKPNTRSYQLYDAISFMESYINFIDGNIISISIDLGNYAYPDKSGFNEFIFSHLNKKYPEFNAFFYGGNQGDDGYFEIKKPIFLYSNNKKFIISQYTTFPLEVGYITPSKTAFYLNENSGAGCLARFPYDSHKVFLLANIKHPRFRNLKYFNKGEVIRNI